jgi:hypothetical protein
MTTIETTIAAIVVIETDAGQSLRSRLAFERDRYSADQSEISTTIYCNAVAF